MTFESEDTYTVTLTINKDGIPWTDNDNLYGLWATTDEGSEMHTGTVNGSSVTFTYIPNCDYSIYSNSSYSNVDFSGTVNNANVTRTMNYYTVTYSAVPDGETTDSSIIAFCAYRLFGSGEAVMEGSVLELTAEGSGANLYSFLWNDSDLTTSPALYIQINQTTNLNCTVTGDSSRQVTAITIASQPSTLVYYGYYQLEFAGLELDLTINDGVSNSTISGVPYIDFNRYGIKVTINSEPVSHNNFNMKPEYHNKPIRLTAGTVSAETDPITLLHSVNYYANGGTGAGIPYDIVTHGGIYTVRDNMYTAPLNYEFEGWTAGSGSSGYLYMPGDIINNFSNSLHMYARWRSLFSLAISPTTWNAPAIGGSTTVNVTSNTSWTAAGNDTSWLTVSPAAGTSNGAITLSAAANPGETRTGIITVTAGDIVRTVSVTQAKVVITSGSGGGGGSNNPPKIEPPVEVEPELTGAAVTSPIVEDWINPFSDVFSSSWFYDDVRFVAENGLMIGSGDQFGPDANLTRGMIVTILYRLNNNPDVSALGNPFDDVSDSQYYADAVQWAAANGIVLGSGDKYRPDENITRQDFTVVLARFADYSDVNLPESRETPVFADDADIAAYAKDAVVKFFKAGVINGKPDNKFDPLGNATRSEAAAMLHRYLNIMMEV
jgi:hypothetical protein